MRRFVAVAVLALAFGAVGTASAQAPTQDSVTGSITAPLLLTMGFDARSGPSGENPSGEVTFGSGPSGFRGPVTCLNVRGNVATLNVDTPPFGLLGFEVTDNAASGTPDMIRAPGSGLRQPGECPPFDPNDGPITDYVASGDLVVVDAQPLPPPPPVGPTAGRDCIRGGYVRFGFRSVGRCLVFVFTSHACKVLERHGHKPRFCPPRLPRR